MSKRRLRRLAVGAVLLVLVSAALATAILKDSSAGASAPVEGLEEVSPAMAAKFAAMAKFGPPGSFKEVVRFDGAAERGQPAAKALLRKRSQGAFRASPD